MSFGKWKSDFLSFHFHCLVWLVISVCGIDDFRVYGVYNDEWLDLEKRIIIIILEVIIVINYS